VRPVREPTVQKADRISHLICLGGYAAARLVRNNNAEVDQGKTILKLIEHGCNISESPILKISNVVHKALLFRYLSLNLDGAVAIAEPGKSLNYNRKSLPVLAGILPFLMSKKRSNHPDSVLAACGRTGTRNNTGKHLLAWFLSCGDRSLDRLKSIPGLLLPLFINR